MTLDTSFCFLRASGTAEVLTDEAVFMKRGKTITICRFVVWEEEKEKTLAEGEFSLSCLDE